MWRELKKIMPGSRGGEDCILAMTLCSYHCSKVAFQISFSDQLEQCKEKLYIISTPVEDVDDSDIGCI